METVWIMSPFYIESGVLYIYIFMRNFSVSSRKGSSEIAALANNNE